MFGRSRQFLESYSGEGNIASAKDPKILTSFLNKSVKKLFFKHQKYKIICLEIIHQRHIESEEVRDPAAVSKPLEPYKWPKDLKMGLSNSQDNWYEEDIAQLLERMENNLPLNDNHTFKSI